MPRARTAPLAALVAIVFGLGMLAAPATAAPVKARAADGFVDSIGVNLHTSFSDTPYVSQFALVKQRLAELGVRHVRDVLAPDRTDQYQRLGELGAAGLGSTLIVGLRADELDELEDQLAVAAAIAGVEALEGPNEYSTAFPPDPDWKENLVAYQQALYAQAKADPDLAALPVIGPSIVHGDQAELGDISASLDLGNIHSYPQGNPPDKLGAAIENAEDNSKEKPIAATETGYHTALAWNGENPPVSEAAMATYMPRLFLEYFRWGIVRTFSYELLDEFPDPEGDEKERNFGLLRNDLTPKLAFDALRNTIEILADPGPAFAPAALDYSLSEDGVPFGGPESPGLHKVLLQKRDGSFYLALWRTTSVWDPAAKAPLPAPADPVEVTVRPFLDEAAEYRPSSSSAPLALSPSGGRLTVEVGPAPVILRLVPGSSVLAPPLFPESPAETVPPLGEPPVAAPRCTVPRLQGRKLKASRTALRRAHCRLGLVTGPRVRRSRVTGQRPKPGRVLAAGTGVSVKLGSDD
jgi:hypothetical protein